MHQIKTLKLRTVKVKRLDSEVMEMFSCKSQFTHFNIKSNFYFFFCPDYFTVNVKFLASQSQHSLSLYPSLCVTD